MNHSNNCQPDDVNAEGHCIAGVLPAAVRSRVAISHTSATTVALRSPTIRSSRPQTRDATLLLCFAWRATCKMTPVATCDNSTFCMNA